MAILLLIPRIIIIFPTFLLAIAMLYNEMTSKILYDAGLRPEDLKLINLAKNISYFGIIFGSIFWIIIIMIIKYLLF